MSDTETYAGDQENETSLDSLLPDRTHAFLRQVGLEYPIIQAPMAGGISSPELIAAVTNAGGLGSLGAGYLTPEQLRNQLGQIKQLTSGTIHVNLFCPPEAQAADSEQLRNILDKLAPLFEQAKLALPALEWLQAQRFPDYKEQVEVLIEQGVKVVSFSFGLPNEETLSKLKVAGIYTMATANSATEAQQIEQRGFDAVVVQGIEAGGHRGGFNEDLSQGVSTLDLIEQTAAAVKIPIIAAGGVKNGKDIAQLIRAGATAAALGTMFIACQESGATESYRQALITTETTALTDAGTGRFGRVLVGGELLSTMLMRALSGLNLPSPIMHFLTLDLRKSYASLGEGYHFAGEGHKSVRFMPAAKLVRALVQEISVSLQLTSTYD